VSRKGSIARVNIKVPAIHRESLDDDPRRMVHDSRVDDEDLIFTIEISRKALLFMVVLISQIVYVYADPVIRAFGFLHRAG
jgi:hypothetical protein